MNSVFYSLKPDPAIKTMLSGRRVIYVDGVFDLPHFGHLELLRRARELGDFLLVGVHSDKTVKSYKRLPIMEQNHRYCLVGAFRMVDALITDAPLLIAAEFIDDWNVAAVVHGDDHFYTEMYRVPIEMSIMNYVPYTKDVSTSNLIARICARHSISASEGPEASLT